MSLIFCQIPSPTTELAALEHLKNECKSCEHSSTFIFDWCYSFLHITRTVIKAWMGLKFGKICPGFTELTALERLKKSPKIYNGRNLVSSLVLSFLNGSSSFLQVTRTTIKAWMGLNFCQIPLHNYWVSCPWAFEKWMYNVVSNLAPSFLIGSYSFLHVTRTAIKAWMGFEIQQDRTWVYGVSCPWISEKFSKDL